MNVHVLNLHIRRAWLPSNSHTRSIIYLMIAQSELPRPILRNSMELDYGCTSRIYFDNAGD